jgi:hypothetical protein
VLACTSSGGAGGSSYPLHELAHLPLEEKARRLTALSDTRRDAAWQAAHPNEFAALVEQTLARLRLGADEPGRAVGARRQLEARIGHDTHARLGSLAVPTLVCGGLFDGVATPAALTNLAMAIPDARLEFFQGGHAFLDQDPRAWERVLAFLAQGQEPAAGLVHAPGLPAGWSPEAILPEILGQAAVAVTVLDLEGRLLFFNHYAPKILDRQPAYLGRDVGELHQPASRAKLTAILAGYRDGELREHTWKLPRGDKTFAVRVAPLVLDGRTCGLVHAVMLLPSAGDTGR